LLPEMVEALIEILRPMFPNWRKDGRDPQRETTADDLPQHIRMGVRSLEARIVVELGIRPDSRAAANGLPAARRASGRARWR
jgi:hypothetical protein